MRPVRRREGLQRPGRDEGNNENKSLPRQLGKMHAHAQLPKRSIPVNVIFTVVGKPFQDWINGVSELRNSKIIEDQNLDIQMDSEIFKIFQASTAVSTKKGNSGMIMKVSTKRRRGKQQIKADKLAEE